MTPFSKVVGGLALFLLSYSISTEELEQLGPKHKLTFTNLVIALMQGSLDQPEED